MKDNFLRKIPNAVFFGVILSVGAILLGFGMGAIFGCAEDEIKNGIERSASSVLETVYKSDAAAKDAVVKKSWDYFKRAHMHWGAIGSANLSCIIILILLCRQSFSVKAVAVLLGFGALIYPVYWLLAGIYAPSMGSTGAAKKMLEWLGMPSSAACLLGVVGTFFCLIRNHFFKSEA